MIIILITVQHLGHLNDGSPGRNIKMVICTPVTLYLPTLPMIQYSKDGGEDKNRVFQHQNPIITRTLGMSYV